MEMTVTEEFSYLGEEKKQFCSVQNSSAIKPGRKVGKAGSEKGRDKLL